MQPKVTTNFPGAGTGRYKSAKWGSHLPFQAPSRLATQPLSPSLWALALALRLCLSASPPTNNKTLRSTKSRGKNRKRSSHHLVVVAIKWPQLSSNLFPCPTIELGDKTTLYFLFLLYIRYQTLVFTPPIIR